MRLVSFVQVLLLLALAAYLLLVALENPQVVRLPLPFGRGELSLPVGGAVALFLVTGAVYAALLFVPPLWNVRAKRRRDVRERSALENRLAATLQARLGAMTPAHPSADAEQPQTGTQLPATQTSGNQP
ncbi:LapA family protein [Deinococcus oregonensis]|uniref:LapA family protein n=1 Tax=Deinococcus oregonensis TaxID=1805970 RepID=A0ABV6B751_9DEIO